MKKKMKKRDKVRLAPLVMQSWGKNNLTRRLIQACHECRRIIPAPHSRVYLTPPAFTDFMGTGPWTEEFKDTLITVNRIHSQPINRYIEINVGIALACWETSKIIYSIDERMFEAICNTRIGDDEEMGGGEMLPWNAAFFAFPKPIDSTDAQNRPVKVAGFYATLNLNDHGEVVTTLVFVDKQNDTVNYINFGPTRALRDLYSVTRIEADKNEAIMDDPEKLEDSAKLLTIASFIMRYCVSKNADIPRRKRMVNVVFPDKDIRIPKAPEIMMIGKNVGDQLRQSDAHIVSLKERGRPIPHIRKAHWHSYWTGPKNDQTKIVKWVAPTFVNASSHEDMPVKIINS